MKFNELALPGVYLIDLEPFGDDRGYFARAWCRQEFEAHGLNPAAAQINLSHSRKAGTLRGLHLQEPPHAEAKSVRCIAGSVFDIAVDMRPDSPTYLQWVGQEISAEDNRMLHVPEGFAHGYQTLTDDTRLLYLVSEFYAPGAEAGFRFDDPAIGIEWPLPVSVISEKDAAWPLLKL